MSFPGIGFAVMEANRQARERLVPVSEVFGPVWQGEGPHTGRLCHFLRTGLCNLSCSWCDTPYTWDHDRFDVSAECPDRDGQWIADHTRTAQLLIWSGGEPLMHQGNPHMHQGIEYVPEVHVETNGTIVPNAWAVDRIAHFTVSPKVNFQGDREKLRIKHKSLAAFAELAQDHRAIFKVVCRDADEVAAAAAFFDGFDLPQTARWVMPEGVTGQAVLDHAAAIADATLEHGLNLTLRQHTLMYGTERAR